jgi:hypothetical protein
MDQRLSLRRDREASAPADLRVRAKIALSSKQ